MAPSPPSFRSSFPEVKPQNFIDGHILAKLRRLKIQPADLCTDASFLRRAALDVTGALPTADEVRAFLKNQDLDKRAKKVDDLLQRPGYAALWAMKFCDLLRITEFPQNAQVGDNQDIRRIYDWLRKRFQENTPFDQLVEWILTATSREGRSAQDWIDEVIILALDQQCGNPAGWKEVALA